jgi:hypothetical protein
MKKLLSVFSVLLLSIISYAQNIHFICFADTDDNKIGKSVKKDVNQMLDFVMSLASDIGIEDNLQPAIVMMGEECNKKNLLTTIEEFKCGKDDIVLFYYSGHGIRAYQDTSEFPQMCLGNSDQDFISLEYVKEKIERKGPGLSIILADCCNSYDSSVTPKEAVMITARARASDKSSHDEGMRKLFLETRGSIIAASSRKGEVSWGNSYYGGLFTNGFLNEIDLYTSSGKAFDWQELMWRTRCRVVADSRSSRKYQGVQTPIYKIEFRNIPSVIRIEDGINKALATVADASISQNQRILQYKDILETFFSSNDTMVDIVGRDMKTLVDYTTAEEYLLRVATGERYSGFNVIEEKKDSNGKITYLRLNETH